MAVQVLLSVKSERNQPKSEIVFADFALRVVHYVRREGGGEREGVHMNGVLYILLFYRLPLCTFV